MNHSNCEDYTSELFYHVKGTVSVIQSDPPCKDGNADLHRQPLKLCLIKYAEDINVNNFEN